MSDVIVSTTESTTDVTTTNDVTTVAITNTVVEISQATAGVQGPPGANSDPTYVYVTNKTGAQLNKGSIVYVSGANGTHTQVSLALATGDVTSARTLGWLAEDIANNATGLCCVEGYLDGIDTQGVTEGAQLYLSTTVAGGFQENKPSAPDHLVYVGVCAKASAGNGRVFVKVQNGYELDELHDVQIISKANKDLLQYDSATNLWKNVASTAVAVGSAVSAGTAVYATNAGTSVYATSSGTSVYATNAGTSVYSTTSGTSVYSATSGTASYATAALSATSSNSAYTALLAGTAVFAANASTATYALSAGTATAFTGSISRSQITDFTSGTVASASTALTAGTASFASQAGTALYSDTSGTAVTISGTITNSQVSDFASGTVANISGTVTQAQVANLTTDLGGKANLTGGNSLSGAQTITASTATQTPLTVISASGQSVNLQEWDNSSGVPIAVLSQSGGFTSGGTARVGQIVSIPASPATVGLVVQGAVSQTADLLQLQNSGSTALFRVFATGGVSATGSAVVVNGASWPFTITQSASSTATITNGGVVRITNAPTGSTRFEADSSAVPVVVRGASGQTANLLELQNSGGTAVALVNPFGAASFGTNSILGRLTVSTGSSGTIGQIIRGVSGQTADYIQIQNDSGGVVAKLTSSANPRFILGTTDTSSTFGVTSHAAAGVVAVVRGAASQSANLQEWQTSSGSTAVWVTNAGLIRVQGDPGGTLGVITNNSTARGVVVRGVASQSVDLIQVQNDTGGTTVRMAMNGQSTFGGTALLGQVTVLPASTATVGVVVQGLLNQSADLQQWQTSTGSTAAYLGSGGAFRAAVLQTSSAAVDARLRNAGGEITFAKATAVSVNPGANYGKIYFRDGTNAGTLKLVVIAGTAGAETTILDNIPQS